MAKKKVVEKKNSKKNEIAGVIFIALAVLCALAIYMNMDSAFGDGVKTAVFGIFGIAFAIISKKTDTWSKKSKIGLILSIIALVVGFVFFYITCITMETMSDPVKSKEVMEYMKELIPQMPEELQEMFNGYI